MPTILQRLRTSIAKADEYIQEHELGEKLNPLTTAFGFLIVLSLVILGIYVVVVVPHTVIQRSLDAALAADRAKQLELEDTYRKTITQIVLGVFGLFLLYFTWRRSVAIDKTVRIAEQGHITDRFTKAIEQLGKADGDKHNIEVRLGAIYALERIALDSPRDHWTIMEVLTAYVRQNAPLDADRPYTEGEKPRTDIQAILTVLGRRRVSPKRERPGQWLDLSRSRLCGADLQYSNLAEADLSHTNLQRASLRGAHLQRASLEEAEFQEADLERANLSRSSAMQASFRNAKLKEASLEGAEFPHCNLEKTHLQEANLRDVNLAHCHLKGASLLRANLENAYLTLANLQEAHLDEANLQGASLRVAYLRKAGLLEANLQDADISEANFIEAVELTTKQIKSAKYWKDAHYSPAFRAELGLPPEPTDEATQPDRPAL